MKKLPLNTNFPNFISEESTFKKYTQRKVEILLANRSY